MPALPGDGRRRVIIESVAPDIDAGRFPVKRIVGEPVVVEADVFTDGHDQLTVLLLDRRRGESTWNETEMTLLVNDRWRASFAVTELGGHEYTVLAWVDRFRTWRHDTARKVDAQQDVSVELQAGAQLIDEAAARARGAATPGGQGDDDADRLVALAKRIVDRRPLATRAQEALSADTAVLVDRYADRSHSTVFEPVLNVVVGPERARFSTWYELFPRSCAPEPGHHGAFADVEKWLPGIADMGFDVLYLPPVHPIGDSFRKGRNNALVADPDDPGSPWAIGSADGGHTAVHPALGTIDDFQRLIRVARDEHGIDVALDLAFQCSPDHPWVKEHPEWFRWRPDGTVQYAENPPKKYQDIYPLEFEGEAWAELWEALAAVVRYWIGVGVWIFRIDNPHTKPFAFWEWLIADIKRDHPEVLFLAEAFTRPRVVHRLAKLGFDQNYTYFTWRTTKGELTDYFTELTQPPGAEYLRPNAWPNTPDILHEYLQTGGRQAFIVRLVLAGTLASSYGIYGPAFELFEHTPRESGSEEYLDSEKYEIRDWELERPDSLRPIIGLVNAARHGNVALQSNAGLRFHGIENDELLCYSKSSPDGSNVVLCVVNLDPHHTQSGWTNLDMAALGMEADEHYEVHDVFGGGRYLWHGNGNYVELDPREVPAHIFVVRRRVRTEHHFPYYE